jgi:hypothetical protein
MKQMLTALLAAAVAGALFIASPLGAMPKGTENYNKSFDTAATGCGDGNSMSVHAPTKLWPPNHKYYEDFFATATDAQGEEIILTTKGVHDQYAEGTAEEQNGAGNTTRDIYVDDDEADLVTSSDEDADPQVVAVETADGTVQTDWAVRAERSGQDQTGRTYTFDAMADFTDGECALQLLIVVPHDMRPSNR